MWRDSEVLSKNFDADYIVVVRRSSLFLLTLATLFIFRCLMRRAALMKRVQESIRFQLRISLGYRDCLSSAILSRPTKAC